MALFYLCRKSSQSLCFVQDQTLRELEGPEEKLKAVKAHLNIEEASQHSESETPSRRRDFKKRLGSKCVCSVSGSPEPRRGQSESPRKRGPERKTMFKRLEKGVFHRLGDKEKGRKHCPKVKTIEVNIKKAEINHIKTYDGSEDQEDHLKIFQAVAKTERWAMPTCCHMFNSTLTGNARVWFDDHSQESIDSYDDLKKAFLENYLHQKKCIKDPVEIHNIKQRDGESTKEFVRRGEVADSNRERKKSFPSWKQQKARQKQNFKKGGFRNQQRTKANQWERPGKGNKKRETTGKDKPLAFLMEVRSQMVPPATPLVVFSREIIWPLGQISLLVKIGDEEHSTSAWMNFMVVKSPSPYNRILGRPRVRRIQAVPSTVYGMLKFLVTGGTVTLGSINIIPLKCTMFSGPGAQQPPENVCGFQGLKQSMPQRWLSDIKNRLEGRVPLWKCTKKSDFQWTAKAKMVFKQMKKLIAKLPMLTEPKEKEELIIYLANAKEAISAVLITEMDRKQMAISFISRALQGPKINYTLMKKLILALAKNLSQGQILADFIVERLKDNHPDTPMEDKEELSDPWILFTDGSLCIDGSGSKLILTNPEGTEFIYALRFRFDTTNNEAEYEALIAGLQIAEHMGVKNLRANELSIKQVHRGENKKEDALSKIESTSFAHLSKQVLVEELKEKSIDEKEVLAVVEEEGRTWITPIYEYLMEEILLEEKRKARAICRDKWSLVQKGNPFKDWCEKLCIRQCFASVKHPQANGLVERANRSLGERIKARLDERSKSQMEEILHVLWVHRTMIKSSNGETLFSLTYGMEAVIPSEFSMPTLRTAKVDMIKNNEDLEINLDLLEERSEQAAIQEAKKQGQDGKIL
nr:hypothetical protein [Tanacetum cinerariifolium]